MSTGVMVDSSEVRSTLAAMCARNCPAELHYAETEHGVKTARVRMLALMDSELCTDRPQNIDAGVDLQAGEAVTVYVVQGESRWAFESRVVKMNRIIRLNDRQRVLGIALAIPHELCPQQRRRDFRVSVSSSGLACNVTPEWPADSYACSSEAQPYRAMIANVSARGIAIVLENVPARCFSFGKRMFLDFRLPDTGTSVVVLAETRHVRDVRSRGNVLVGLSFLPTPLLDDQHLRKELSAFVVGEQRRKLRRRR